MAPLVTVITGCSSGIGLATAVKLAKDPEKSYLVYATMRNLASKSELEKAAGDSLNDTLFIRELDVTKEDQIVSTVQYLMDQHGRVDILLNNAGFGHLGPLEDMAPSHVRSMIDTNLIGTILMTREVIPIMKIQRSGRIINISSLAGISGLAFSAVYSASKFAMEGFTESLYPELRCFDVWITSICPGPVATNFQDNMGANKDSKNPSGTDMESPTGKLFAGMMQAFGKAVPPSAYQVADGIVDVIVGCLKDSEPRLRYATNQYGEQRMSMTFGSDDGGGKMARKWYDSMRPIMDS